MATIKQVIITKEGEIGLNQSVEVTYDEKYIYRGVIISINQGCLTVATPDRDNPYLLKESYVFEPEKIDIRVIERDKIYENYEREIKPEPVEVKNDITYTVADLDKRVCDIVPNSVSEITLREFIRSSEGVHGMEQINIDNMKEEELNEYIRFLGSLLEGKNDTGK